MLLVYQIFSFLRTLSNAFVSLQPFRRQLDLLQDIDEERSFALFHHFTLHVPVLQDSSSSSFFRSPPDPRGRSPFPGV